MIVCSPATTDDVEFMWQMLYFASWSDHQDGVTLDDVRANPDLSRHLSGWGSRRGDLGMIARDGERRVGACWVRRLIGDETLDPTYVDDDTPELAIAVEPDTIGSGAGTKLLSALLAATDASEVEQVVLTTRATNPAVSLYERHGFVETQRITNRIGTESLKMIRRRPAA